MDHSLKIPLRKFVSQNSTPFALDVKTLSQTSATPLVQDELNEFQEAVKKRNAVCILLAAGQGSRFISDIPKVVHPFNGKALVQYSIDAAMSTNLPTIVIVGHARIDVVKTVSVPQDGHVVFVTQEAQMGTGHAVYMAKAALREDFDGDVIISYADNPGVDVDLLADFEHAHARFKSDDQYGAMVVTGSRKLGGEATNAYGRIVREGINEGCVLDIVEKKVIDRLKGSDDVKRIGDLEWSADALDKVDDFNSGIVVARAKAYLNALGKVFPSVTKKKADGTCLKMEFYATDFVKVLKEDGYTTRAFQVAAKDMWKLEGTNTVEELNELMSKMQMRQ